MSIIKYVLEGDETCSWIDVELCGGGGGLEFNYSVQYSIFLLSTNRKLVIQASLTI